MRLDLGDLGRAAFLMSDGIDVDAGKSDTVDLTQPALGIYVGVGGDIKVTLAGLPNASGAGATLMFKNVPGGTVLPVIAKRVYATGTTATSLIGGK